MSGPIFHSISKLSLALEAPNFPKALSRFVAKHEFSQKLFRSIRERFCRWEFLDNKGRPRTLELNSNCFADDRLETRGVLLLACVQRRRKVRLGAEACLDSLSSRATLSTPIFFPWPSFLHDGMEPRVRQQNKHNATRTAE